MSFSLFMHSLAKPQAFYQVCPLPLFVECPSGNPTMLLRKILLSQGIGAGLGAGMLYLPSITVVSHYFHHRRALAMTIVSSGTSIGAVVHPIMLNNLLGDTSTGFAVAARANAGLISGLLLIACLLMRSRTAPPAKPMHLLAMAVRFAKDRPYVFAALG